MSPYVLATTLTVNNGATLNGNGGTLNAGLNVTSGGEVQPGGSGSAGCLTVNGAVTFASGSTLDVDIEGTTACSEHDQLIVVGTADVGGANLNIAGSYVPTAYETFTVLANDDTDAVGNIFDGYSEDSSFPFNGSIVYITYVGSDGNDVVFDYKYDDDNDGATNDVDAFPQDASETTDTDNDGIGNNADWDDDNDGVPDVVDADPLDNGNTDEVDLPLDAEYKGLLIEIN